MTRRAGFTPAYKASGIDVVYRSVTEHFDRLLAARGYERGDHPYAAVRPNTENLFCSATSASNACFSLAPVRLLPGRPLAPHRRAAQQRHRRHQRRAEPGTAIFRMSRFGDLASRRRRRGSVVFRSASASAMATAPAKSLGSSAQLRAAARSFRRRSLRLPQTAPVFVFSEARVLIFRRTHAGELFERPGKYVMSL